ncbi:hypothetical protein [Nonomuraea sp. NEAU-A123]|nr:hypothetical protein [Nonomuraea sp. NEAU-A123]MBT2231049.1 hypothetical protein [Nonomuraea sp. NEAU-A123]
MIQLSHLEHAPSVSLPAAEPKPTSLTGQSESTLEVWAGSLAETGV